MTEKAFWRKYFVSMAFHRQTPGAAAHPGGAQRPGGAGGHAVLDGEPSRPSKGHKRKRPISGGLLLTESDRRGAHRLAVLLRAQAGVAGARTGGSVWCARGNEASRVRAARPHAWASSKLACLRALFEPRRDKDFALLQPLAAPSDGPSSAEQRQSAPAVEQRQHVLSQLNAFGRRRMRVPQGDGMRSPGSGVEVHNRAAMQGPDLARGGMSAVGGAHGDLTDGPPLDAQVRRWCAVRAKTVAVGPGRVHAVRCSNPLGTWGCARAMSPSSSAAASPRSGQSERRRPLFQVSTGRQCFAACARGVRVTTPPFCVFAWVWGAAPSNGEQPSCNERRPRSTSPCKPPLRPAILGTGSTQGEGTEPPPQAAPASATEAFLRHLRNHGVPDGGCDAAGGSGNGNGGSAASGGPSNESPLACPGEGHGRCDDKGIQSALLLHVKASRDSSFDFTPVSTRGICSLCRHGTCGRPGRLAACEVGQIAPAQLAVLLLARTLVLWHLCDAVA